jgi:uncharacterized repeat protein (TIGR01451 family)
MNTLQKFFSAFAMGIVLAGSIFASGSVAVAHADTTCSVALAMSDSVSNASPQAGDTITYTLTGSPAFTAATDVTVTDILGAGLTFVSAVPSTGTYASSTGIWNVGTLNGASQISLSLVAKVNSGTEGQTIANSPGITYVQTSCTQSSAITGVSITVQPSVVVAPATSTLTVNVYGLQGSDTAEVAVDDFTAGTVQATSTGNGSASYVLTRNDSYAVTATTTAPGYTVATSTGCAGTLATNAVCYISFTLAPATPTSTVQEADMAIVKTVDNATPQVGDTVHYTLTVSDLGPDIASGVMATDTLPSGLTFENATASVGSYASSTGTWNVITMTPGQTETLDIAAMVNAGTAGDTITNTGYVTQASPADPDLANNSSSVSITVQAPSAPTQCVLSASQFESAVQDGQITFNSISLATSTAAFTIVNHTGCTAPISLSSYKVFIAPTSTGWLATQQLFDATSVPAVAPSSTQTFTVNTASCETQVDAWYGQAPVTLLDSDPYKYPNVPFLLAFAYTNVGNLCSGTSTPAADIAITKTVDNANPAARCDTVNYTLAVPRLGPATSTGVVATDTLPSGLTFENATASVGVYASSTGTWTIGDLVGEFDGNVETSRRR